MRIVIPSVNYADILEATLPAWRGAFPGANLVVVTSPADAASAAVARNNGVRAVITDAWTRSGSILNVAAAKNEAFGFAGEQIERPEPGELCIGADADVLPVGVLDTAEDHYDAGTIYGAPRFFCPNKKALSDHLAGMSSPESLGLLAKGSDSQPVYAWTEAMAQDYALKCLGYFQLFRAGIGRKFQDRPTAQTYDGIFARSFAARARVRNFYLLHLGPRSKKNWSGRVVPPWR